MNGHANGDWQLAAKIARLVEERGWNQEDFARHTQLSRHTVRQILTGVSVGKLHNATVSYCARALGLTVGELREQPLGSLLLRMWARRPPASSLAYEQATQPQLVPWLERNPQRALQLSAEETDELLSLQGTGGPLNEVGVEHFVKEIERKRRLLEKIHAIAGTEQIDLLEQLVDLLYEKVQPYRDRA